MNEHVALTTSHITTLLTIGVVFSGALACVVEGLVRRRWKRIQGREEWAKKWLPIWLGLLLGTPLFPAVYSLVVEPVVRVPVQLDWWLVLRIGLWLLYGAFAGIVGGFGAWFAHDLAKAIVGKVAQ